MSKKLLLLLFFIDPAAPTTASEFAVAINKGFKHIRDGSEGD